MATTIPANRAPLDARSAAEATGGRVARGHDRPRTAIGITSDSRAAVPGCAFVALRGERVDGHAHVRSAIDAGAVLVVVERGRMPAGADVDGRADVVEVDDGLAAWGALARAHARAWRDADPSRRIVAITGSAGKTTTKELCAALLRTTGECHATAGNLNNRVGVPAVVFGLEARHRFAVVEVGMSVPGEIERLASIVEPDVAVVTNVGLAHAGGVGGTLDDVAREKGALYSGVRAGGVRIANADDDAVMREVARGRAERRMTFGVSETADIRLVAREPFGLRASQVLVQRGGGAAERFVVPIAGQAAALDFVAALGAADAAADSIDAARIAAALASLPVVPGRMNVRRLRDVVVIDDAYNANPASMSAALATLAEIADGRRVAVLGEMKELGEAGEQEHAALGDAVARAGVGLLITCGGLADVVARAAAERGVDVAVTSDARAAASVALARVGEGDTVLVKGSRSVGAEHVVEALVRAHGPETDDGARAGR